MAAKNISAIQMFVIQMYCSLLEVSWNQKLTFYTSDEERQNIILQKEIVSSPSKIYMNFSCSTNRFFCFKNKQNKTPRCSSQNYFCTIIIFSLWGKGAFFSFLLSLQFFNNIYLKFRICIWPFSSSLYNDIWFISFCKDSWPFNEKKKSQIIGLLHPLLCHRDYLFSHGFELLYPSGSVKHTYVHQ